MHRQILYMYTESALAISHTDFAMMMALRKQTQNGDDSQQLENGALMSLSLFKLAFRHTRLHKHTHAAHTDTHTHMYTRAHVAGSFICVVYWNRSILSGWVKLSTKFVSKQQKKIPINRSSRARCSPARKHTHICTYLCFHIYLYISLCIFVAQYLMRPTLGD